MGRARSVRELAPLAVLAALGALIVAGLPWPCPLLAWTGIPCPACGMTRAFRLALRGDFAGATRMHPLWLVVGIALAAVGAQEIRDVWRAGEWGRALGRRWVRIALGTVGVALVVVWLARFGGAFGGPIGRAGTP